jgi:hypothetical protein
MPMVLEQLSERLGYNATQETLEAAWTACAFEYAIDGQANHWCQLIQTHPEAMDQVDAETANVGYEYHWMNPLQLVDFLEDVRHYFKFGSGSALNQRLACKLFTRIVSEMHRSAYGHPGPRWWLRFTHTGTILLMLNQLGLYTEPISFHQDRGFRTSRITPFAANIHFELLRCGDNAPPPKYDASLDFYYVRMLLNEKVVRIPGCPADQDICPWSQFQRVLLDRIGDCDFEAICQVTKPNLFT